MLLIYQNNVSKKIFKISKDDDNEYILNEQELLYINNTTNEHCCIPTKIFVMVGKQDFNEKYSQIRTRSKSYSQEINEEVISKIKF